MMVVCFLSCVTKLVQISRIVAENDQHFVRDVRLMMLYVLVTLAFQRGYVAALYKILCKYLHPVRKY